MLEVERLNKDFVVRHNFLARFGHPDHVIHAVNDVSFKIKKGEIFGIAGKSGSGKTTLGKIILRLLEPTSGSVLYKGQNVFEFNPDELKDYRRQVQVVFQDADSTPDPRQKLITALEEPLLVHRIANKSERRAIIEQALEQVNLPVSLVDRYPSALSGGQRRRAALARALVLKPEVIIADEPITGLDPVVSAQILSLLLKLNREFNLTLIIITHDLGAINYLSDRVAVMYGGKIVELVDGNLFESSSLHPYTRFLQGVSVGGFQDNGNTDIHQRSGVAGEGCIYAGVCPRAKPECFDVSPQLQELNPGHLVACQFTLEQ